MDSLRFAFYGDDFTGSVDVLLQLRRAGWTSRLFLGLPDPEELKAAAGEVDAVGIAGVARSLPTGTLAAEVQPALEALAALGPRILQYKACSTADSSPSIGSLGRVLEIAQGVFGPATVPMLFAQPDFGRYTAFGHHFAAEQGTVHRLDRQPTMSAHPTTPMDESDLARHLSRQTHLAIGSLHLTEYTDAQSIAANLAQRSEAATVLDAITDGHVDMVGEAVVAAAQPHTPQFVLGSGGFTRGLAAALSQGAETLGAGSGQLNPDGPVLAVSGSQSHQTARQVQDARRQGWTVLELSGRDDAPLLERVLAELSAGRSVVVTTGADAAEACAGLSLVETLAARLSAVVEAALHRGATRRVIVCGGDTSSHVLVRLGARSLSIASNPVGNVVLCTVGSAKGWVDGVEMLLKGGQVGPVDLFETIRTLGSRQSAASIN
ncbi:four-carbon acid sugar kinase family protein [Arthrobacter sp. 35W]|uniref:four-carbon acid sugar kinase family protein n=1 Tax=Arthrobacter sp. 35W TaxID=1132441 RepID=UPI0006886BA4|nr:four-carbon acid sugar kinase family protein [Arthrobacter sp. 35W]